MKIPGWLTLLLTKYKTVSPDSIHCSAPLTDSLLCTQITAAHQYSLQCKGSISNDMQICLGKVGIHFKLQQAVVQDS